MNRPLRADVRRSLTWILVCLALPVVGLADQTPLQERIDDAIQAAHDGPWAPQSSDEEFLRRVYLDLAGVIPTAQQAREFLQNQSAGKRAALIDKLLEEESFARRMQYVFDVMLLERRKSSVIPNEEWKSYLRESFANGKPLNELVRELISADGVDEATRPAMNFFLARSATNHKLLARDVNRLLLGRDMECAQCHDHPSVKDFRQANFFGVLPFLNRSYLHQDKTSKKPFFAERGSGEKVAFSSVFTGETGSTFPRIPGGEQIAVVQWEKNGGAGNNPSTDKLEEYTWHFGVVRMFQLTKKPETADAPM